MPECRRESFNSCRVVGLINRLREIVTHTAVYGVGTVLNSILGLVLVPLYTRQFAPDVFGILSLLTLAGTLAGAVFYLGVSSALARSYYDYEDPEERATVVSTSVLLTLLGAAAQMITGVLLAAPLSRWLLGSADYAPHLLVAFGGSAATFVSQLFYVVLRFQRRSVMVVAINIGGLLLTFVAILWLLHQNGPDVMAPLLGTLIGQAAMAVALAWACRKTLPFAISRREIGIQLRFGAPTVLVALAYYLLTGIDRFALSQFASLTDVGVYSLGSRVGVAIHMLFIMPFAQIWTPMRMQYRRDADAPRLFSRVLTYYFVAGMLLTVLICAFAREIVQIVAGRPEYQGAYIVVPFIALSHLFYGGVNVIDNGILFSRRIHLHAMAFAGAAVLNALLNFWLVPHYGYLGAAAAALCSYLALIAVVAYVSNRLEPLHPEGGRLTAVFVSGIATIVITSLVPTVGVTSAAGKLMMVVMLMTGWYALLLTHGERANLRRLVSRRFEAA